MSTMWNVWDYKSSRNPVNIQRKVKKKNNRV